MHTLIRNAEKPDGTARGVREGREVRGQRRALALLLPVERPDAGARRPSRLAQEGQLGPAVAASCEASCGNQLSGR